MKYLLLAGVLFVSAITAVVAQSSVVFRERQAPNTPCPHIHATALALQAQESAVQRRPYDVLSYSLDVDWTSPLSTIATTAADRIFPAVNTMRIRIDSANVQALAFDARSMTINRVTINGQEVGVEQPTDGILTVPLPNMAGIGEELTVRIEYTHIPTGTTNVGFHLYAKGGQTLERVAYTLGAPDYARYWLPCNDNAYDKARIDFHVTVPPEYSVACNGLPDSVTTAPDGTNRIHHWSDSTPTATYLMVIQASVYHEFSDVYVRPNGTDTVPLLYYVWEDDFDGPGYHAQEKFAPVPDMIAWFSAHYGAYPFAKYGMAVAKPFDYFAMENQTMTTLVREAINEESTIAHELSHQWLGDFVSPATWNDVWMNEGGATFSEALWAEHTPGADGYKTTMADKRAGYLLNNTDGTKQPPCYRDLDANPMGSNIYNYAITYAKGAWIYHMLRQLLGDDVFFPMLREFLAAHAYGTAETADMVSFFTEYLAEHNITPAVSMSTFFDQWVYKKGHPVYRVEAALGPQDDSVTVVVTLTQTQPTQPVFTMPVDIGFTGPNQEYAIRTFLNTERVQTVTFRLPFAPVSATANPDNTILAVTQQATVTDVRPPAADSDITIFPNPSSGGSVHILLAAGAVRPVVAEVFSPTGECVAMLYNGVPEAGQQLLSWNTSAVSTGVYLVRIRRGTDTTVRTISVTR